MIITKQKIILKIAIGPKLLNLLKYIKGAIKIFIKIIQKQPFLSSIKSGILTYKFLLKEVNEAVKDYCITIE